MRASIFKPFKCHPFLSHICREREDRGDKKTSEELFKLIRKMAQRSEVNWSENGAYCSAGQNPVDQPANRRARRT